jgi:hypothetical protein
VAQLLRYTDRYEEQSENELMKELKIAVNNVLIERRSVWRYGRKWPLSTRRQSGKGWEVVEGGRTFWDWVDEADGGPENREFVELRGAY